MTAKVGIVQFLGTNCDRDTWQAIKKVGLQPQWLWYQHEFNVDDFKAIVLPGGFSYGDYLRSGALAAKSPVMKSVKEAADKGLPVLGICNGFQILCDAGLLPGALLPNESGRFIDKWVDLNLANGNSHWGDRAVEKCNIPVAHADGRYFIDDEGLTELQNNQQIWWRYASNPNGSVDSIAGVYNKKKNVAGLMPHPERAMESWMGSASGTMFFESLVGA